MAQWPASLPAPALNTLRETPPNNSIASQMDKGPAKVRRRTTANVRPISFIMKCTPDQIATLDDFYDNTTFSGSVDFDYTHPRTGAAVTARFKPETPPTWDEQEGVLYNATIELEILP